MDCNFSRVWLIGLCLVLSWTKTAASQTLSIYRDTADRTRLEATSSLDLGYRLQSSLDFQNWTDLSDAASGPFAYTVETTKDAVRFFRLRTWTTQDAPITLVIVGDSTAADYVTDDNRFSGWGQGIYARMKPNVLVVNLAVPNQSTLSFLYSIQKDNLIKIKPDFVLIQFGFVDSSTANGLHTEISDYESNLRTIIQTVRDFQGTPVLLTPTGVRYFDGTDKIIPVLQDRVGVVRDLADQLHTYLIDLNQLTTTFYNQLGSAKVDDEIESHPGDGAHFSVGGADQIADLVVHAFPGILSAQVLQP